MDTGTWNGNFAATTVVICCYMFFSVNEWDTYYDIAEYWILNIDIAAIYSRNENIMGEVVIWQMAFVEAYVNILGRGVS